MSKVSAPDTNRRLKVALAERLGDLGFRHRYLLEVPLRDGFVGTVGLNHATWPGHPGWINVLPVIGVSSEPLARLMAEFTGNANLKRGALWAFPVSAIERDISSTWWFGPDLDPASVDALAAMLRERAMPILRASASLEGVRAHIEAGHSHYPWLTLPVVLAALGRSEEALSVARSYLEPAELGYPRPLRANQEQFIERLETWIDAGAPVG